MQAWDAHDTHCFVVPTSFFFLGPTLLKSVLQPLTEAEVARISTDGHPGATAEPRLACLKDSVEISHSWTPHRGRAKFQSQISVRKDKSREKMKEQ